MSEKEPSYIAIKGIRVGILGLREMLEELSTWKGKKDEEIADRMLQELKTKNYIPPSVETEYKQAFLREFKKFVGEPVAEEKTSILNIAILGPGCPICDQLEQMVMAVLTEENIGAEVEHVRDVREIASYGMVATPALVINGKIKSYGRLPSRSQITNWIKECIQP
ncbi:MAG: thioredoxin family protein [Deltaproteobacteria bacterium]|nr:thioredoxin family protein [Deltaproteobacteria bacterium]